MNKVPSNVLSFATEKNLPVYLKFRDYWNHYMSINGGKKLDFATTKEDGTPISFSEKEDQMNSALKREILRVAQIQNFDEFALEQWATHPMVSWATFAVVSAMIDMILPESIIDSIGAYTEIRNIGWGDSAAFNVKPRDLFVVSKHGRGQRSVEARKQFNGQVTILPEMREISVQVSFYKVLAGLESLADFVAKAVRSIDVQVTIDAYDAFAAAMAALPTTATTGLRVSTGYTQADLVRLCQQVTAWNGGAKAVVLGTQLALVSVLPDDANYRYMLESDYVKIGYIRTAFGYDVMAMPQVADWTTPWGMKLSDDYLWIVSPSSQKLLKLVFEGNTLSNTSQPFQNSNLTQDATLWKSWGIGVATNATSAAINL